RRHLVDLALQLHRPADAIEHTQALLQAAPTDGELEHLCGECLEAAGKLADAKGRYEKAIAAAPQQVKRYARLAWVQRPELKGAAAADARMAKLIATNEASGEAWLAHARYLRVFGAREPDRSAREKLLEQAAADVGKARQLITREGQGGDTGEAD